MEKTDQNKKNSQSIAILIFSVLVMAVIAFLFATDMEKIKLFIRQAGIWGPLVSVFVYVMLGMTVIPSEPITLLIGALFGPLTATLVAGTGNTLAAIVEFYLGRHLGKATNFLEKKEKLPLGLGKLKVESPMFLIGARMIPGYGPKVVSVLAGVYHVPLWRYIWTTAIPVFLGALIFAYGGHGLGLLSKLF